MKTKNLTEILGATDLRGKLATNDEHQWKTRNTDNIRGVVIHQALSDSTLENIAKYHTSHRSHLRPGGVHSIAYTLGIRRNGQICLLNDWDAKPWSQGDRNTPGDENALFLSVMLEGKFSYPALGSLAGEPTISQMQSTLFLFQTLAKENDWGIKDIWGHCHFGKSACPGNTMQNIIDAIRNQYDFGNGWKIDYNSDAGKDRKRFITNYGFKSVEEFQEYSELTVDGVWGDKTSAAAYSRIARA